MIRSRPRPRPRGAGRRVLLAAATAAAALAAPVAARADTTVSQNWSGYAAHGRGVRFRHVVGTWRQPSGSCAAGTQSFSAFWVGIGGYSLNSSALEQIGSELDCNPDGTAALSAWYELVPAASQPIRMTIRGGDTLRASVTVSGPHVTLAIADLTLHEFFRRTITDRATDLGSAEWIAEAPSGCDATLSSCTTLPLADFGSVRFSGASATTLRGRTGTIVSRRLWQTTKIVLGTPRSRFVATASAAGATPSPLTARGRVFSVAFSGQPAGAAGGTASTAALGRQRGVERVGPRAG